MVEIPARKRAREKRDTVGYFRMKSKGKRRERGSRRINKSQRKRGTRNPISKAKKAASNRA